MGTALAAAGIGAAGSILGGITGGKGAKAAAKAQLKSTKLQIAANQQNLAKITGLEQPTIDRGNAAGDLYGNFLGLNGGDAASKALETYRGSTGYQDLLKTGLGAVNSNAYASGTADSGATLKALQAKGMALADQSAGTWLGGVNNLVQTGNAAIGNIAGVNTATTAANNAARQSGADASSNAALAQSASWQKALSGLTSIGSNYASSYGGGGTWNGSGAFPSAAYGWGP